MDVKHQRAGQSQTASVRESEPTSAAVVGRKKKKSKNVVLKGVSSDF